MRKTFKALGAKGVLGKDEQWWENKANFGTVFSVGTLLTVYEVVQAIHSREPLDVKDLVAYMAGIGICLGGEKIWQEYLLFKEEFGLKLTPFLRERKKEIMSEYLLVVDDTRELMRENLADEY